ncbi:MAG TPA: hypothetical protein VI072_31270 [Polyangiaceae bacterium]
MDRSTHSFERALIESQPVCIVSKVWSAGELGETLAYHYRRSGDRIEVGYFAFWSTERPWGDNALTLTVLPAAAIDAVYSHFLFVLPGMRAAMYGPGDVEGATVTYRISSENTLEALGAVAQDGVHDDVELSPVDLLDADGRVILMSEVWSHQLGAKGAAAYLREAGTEPRCFHNRSLSRLEQPLIARFRLGSAESPARARPAWRAVRRASNTSSAAPRLAAASL